MIDEEDFKLDENHRVAFSILVKEFGKSLAIQEWIKYYKNTKKARPVIIKPKDLYPDEIAMLLAKGRVIPNTLRNKTLESRSGLRVTINSINRPNEWTFTPKNTGVRGNWHKTINLGIDGTHRGHIYGVCVGANKDIIDDGIFNIIPQSPKFNQKYYSNFEIFMQNNLIGHQVKISQPQLNGLVNINIVSKGINVKVNPLTTSDNWPSDWYLTNGIWR